MILCVSQFNFNINFNINFKQLFFLDIKYCFVVFYIQYFKLFWVVESRRYGQQNVECLGSGISIFGQWNLEINLCGQQNLDFWVVESRLLTLKIDFKIKKSMMGSGMSNIKWKKCIKFGQWNLEIKGNDDFSLNFGQWNVDF